MQVKNYYLYDGHGSVTQLTSEAGKTIADYRYDAFGNQLHAEKPTVYNPFRYSGEYTDSESGMIYLRARYYDPSIGRFISEDSHWNINNMIYGDNSGDIPIPSTSAIMQSGNLYAYCTNDPVNAWDPSGGNWLTNKIKDMFNAQLDAEMTKTKSMNENQQEMQRDFWRMGSEKFLRNTKGYLTSAWMLEHSLQNNPTDEWRGNDSRIAYLVNNDAAYLSALDKKIKSSSNGKIDGYLDMQPFKTGDLYYSIHKSSIYVNGYKQNNGKWLVYAKLTDTYDFTEIQSFMNDNGGWSKQAGLGTAANDAAVISQLLGAINPYKITVEFYTTR